MLRKRQSVFSRGPRESPLLGNAQVPENGCLLRHDIGRRAARSRRFLCVEGADVGFELGGITAINAGGRHRHVDSKTDPNKADLVAWEVRAVDARAIASSNSAFASYFDRRFGDNVFRTLRASGPTIAVAPWYDPPTG